MKEIECVVNMFIENLTEEMRQTQSLVDKHIGKLEEQKRSMMRFSQLKEDMDSMKEN